MNILIAAYTGLGNAILLTPLIMRMKDIYPSSMLYVVGDDKFLALSVVTGLNGVNVINASSFNDLTKQVDRVDLAILPRYGNVSWLEKGLRKTGVKIVKHYDHYLINSYHHKSKPVSKLKLLIQMICRWNTQFVPVIPCRHEVELNLDLLRQCASAPVASLEVGTGLKPSVSDLGKFNLLPGKYLVLQPSVANGNYSSKRWMPSNFEKISKMLLNDYPELRVVLVGDSGDKGSMSGIIWQKNVLDLLGKTNLQEFASLLAYSRVALVHDSGAMHLGVAIKSKVIALLGPTDFYRTGPYSSTVECLYSTNKNTAEMFNFNLTEAESSQLSPDFEAMNGISIETVYSAIRKYL